MESDVCRACLQTDTEKHHIFTEFSEDINLQEILTDTTGFQVAEDDGLSPFLCSNCTNIVVDFYYFKQTFAENENHNRRALLMSGDAINQDYCAPEETAQKLDDLALCEEIKNDFDKVLENYSVIKLEIYSDSDENVDGTDDIFHIVEHEEVKRENVDFGKIEAHNNNVENKPNGRCCPICNENFNHFKDIRRHMRCHKLNVCHICGGNFGTKWDLTEHVKGHLEERNFVCEICDRSFKRKKYLVKHKRTHTNPRDRVCELCGKAFNDKSTLNTHVRLIHLRQKNLVCPICNRNFSLKATLDKHILRHQDRQREFHCEMCSSEFRDKSTLQRHVLVRHSGTFVKPKCHVCGKQFSHTGILTRHRRNVHGEIKLTNDVELAIVA